MLCVNVCVCESLWLLLCVGGVPMVETGGGEVRVVIDEGCPSETHVLVVVQGVGSGQARPLGSYSVAELKQLTKEYTSRQQSRRQVSQATIYIAANVTRGRPLSTLCVQPVTRRQHPPAMSSLSPQAPISHSNWGTVLNTGATLITPCLQTQTTSWGLCLCLQTRQSLPCLLHLEASVSVSLCPYGHYMYIQS